MTTYTIEYDLTELRKLADNFPKNMTEAALPNTAEAFNRAALLVRQMWRDYLAGSQQLNGIDFLSGVTSSMVQSIRARQNGDFDHTVYSDNIQLERKTKGQKKVEYDMKQTHPYGKKSRVSKKGIPYLIVKFRWKTPQKSDKLAHSQYFSSIIPTKYYNTALKGIEISSKNDLKNYFEKNFKGENIERQGYNWAKFGRLTDSQAWDDRSVGMVKMLDDSNPKRITSTYFTFRIISAKSPANSWIYHKDAVPGVDVLAALERTTSHKIENIINEGIAADNEMYKNMQ